MNQPAGGLIIGRVPSLGRTILPPLVLLAVLVLSACGADHDAVVARFVDPQMEAVPAPSTEADSIPYDAPKRLPWPDGVIDDERRYVLLARDSDPVAEGLPIRRGAKRITRGPLMVPGGAYLEFGYGVPPGGCPPGASPLSFRVYASWPGAAREPQQLFEGEVQRSVGAEEPRWLEARVDLAELEGQRVLFTFEGWGPGWATLRCRFYWSNPTVYAREPRRGGTPNFILISLDTLRASNLGTYGYGLETSPFLDELARESAVVFERALTTSASTPQAHMSMFTGLYPSVHGITLGHRDMPRGLVTLTEILRQAGYKTGAITEDGLLAAKYGFARGMNTYRENKSPELTSPTGQVDVMVDEGLRWLERNRRKKFFLFLHTYQVHDPHAPPPDYQPLYSPYVHEGRSYSDEDLPENLRYMRSYDREIRYTDDELARLFEGLREFGLLETTVIIITSDHGEEFLEHGRYKHGANLYDREILLVPLIVRGPGAMEEPRRIRTPVSIADLTPTILDLAGLPRLEEVQGISLAEVLRDPDAPLPPERVLFAEAWGMAIGPDRQMQHWRRPGLAARSSRFKYLLYNGKRGHRWELYDLEEDPGEMRNLARRKPDPWPEGRRLLQTYRKRSAALQRALLSGEPLAQQQRPLPLDPEETEKLRALGYID